MTHNISAIGGVVEDSISQIKVLAEFLKTFDRVIHRALGRILNPGEVIDWLFLSFLLYLQSPGELKPLHIQTPSNEAYDTWFGHTRCMNRHSNALKSYLNPLTVILSLFTDRANKISL